MLQRALSANYTRLLLPLALTGVSALASGCSALIDTSERQCSAQADCAALGFEGDVCIDEVCQSTQARQASLEATAWGCLGNTTRPASGANRVSLTILILDVITTLPPQDLQVRFCPKLDVNCEKPLPGEFDFDVDGRLVTRLQAGFDGYVELTSPTTTPALFFVTQPVLRDTTVQNVLPVVSPESFGRIAQAIGTTLDLDNLGHTYALASDCTGAPAGGVRLDVDRTTATTASYYMINNVPVASAAATDAAGGGGFLNLLSGFTRITGFVSATGARIGQAGFIVRKGAVSYPLVLPAP